MSNVIANMINQFTTQYRSTNSNNWEDQLDTEEFAECLVNEVIDEFCNQLWKHGIDQSNNPQFYKAMIETKNYFGV